MDAAAGMSWFPGAPDGNSAHRAQEPGAVVRHQTGAQGHLRHGVLDPLAGLGRRHGGARARRQRLRRRRRGRLRAAGGRAAPERARRRGADGALQRRARAGHGGRRPGALAGGGVPRPGGRLRNPALAATWRRLLAEAEAASADRDRQIEAARVAFYEGFVADAIDRFAAGPAVMDVTGDDLARWRAGCEQPSVFDYRGVRVCKTGPWGQGPVFLQQLGLLAGFDLAAMEPGGADCVHTVVECAKLAFADREAWYGDPAFVDVPLAGLLDPAYAERRRALIGAEASMELRPGGDDAGDRRGQSRVVAA